MQIPRVDSDPLHKQLRSIDPKLLALIEKYANRPLLLEKILLSDSQGIQLESKLLGKNWTFKLPIKGAESLANVNLEKPQLLLNPIRGKVMINLASANQSLSAIPQATLTALKRGEIPLANALPGSIQLVFNQANLISPQVIGFANQLAAFQTTQNKSEGLSGASSAPQPGTVNSLGASTSTAKSSATTQLTDKSQIAQLARAFLQNRPLTQQSISMPIDNLLKNNQKLIQSMTTPSQSGVSNNSFKLDNAAILELARSLLKYLPKGSPGRQIGQLILTGETLKSALEMAPTGKSVSNRILNSGVLLENKLAQSNFIASAERQSPRANMQGVLLDQKPPQTATRTTPESNTAAAGRLSQDAQNRFNQAAQNAEQGNSRLIAQDLKSVALQLLEQLTNVKKFLNQNAQQPLNLNQAIGHLAKNSAFQKILLPPELLLAGASNDPKATLQHNSEVVSQQSQKAFSSRLLQNFPWLNLINLRGKNSPISAGAKLLETQRALVSELIRDANSLLSRIETNQLVSLKNDVPNIQQLFLELPLQKGGQIDAFEILFESTSNPEEEVKKTWNITIRFDLEPMGPMFARVTMQGDRISTHFFAENPSTAELLTENIDVLKDSLLASGVDIDQINGSQGHVPEELLPDDEHKVNLKI
ncbi:flagellar hook-length control protein FliK [Aliikangiella marina]|uniref:Flagellar hook-length control protein FliK n=1 Tax=Aliikangiella marina TaxID=1712262 RepID=A0A545T2I1_9GAMM|nr:flagellar hook-length control protein FliK [Aliikangiella marina]TQV71424.1 flagellar hook-length control protein FliK [Aliikangiella marina]